MYNALQLLSICSKTADKYVDIHRKNNAANFRALFHPLYDEHFIVILSLWSWLENNSLNFVFSSYTP